MRLSSILAVAGLLTVAQGGAAEPPTPLNVFVSGAAGFKNATEGLSKDERKKVEKRIRDDFVAAKEAFESLTGEASESERDEAAQAFLAARTNFLYKDMKQKDIDDAVKDVQKSLKKRELIIESDAASADLLLTVAGRGVLRHWTLRATLEAGPGLSGPESLAGLQWRKEPWYLGNKPITGVAQWRDIDGAMAWEIEISSSSSEWRNVARGLTYFIETAIEATPTVGGAH